MSPYRDAAEAYYRAGWAPLPLRGKGPPPDGWTGANGAWPSFADVYAWAEGPEGELNIGLRMPAHVLGIDVDDYDGKHGARTLAEHEARLGPLPATWISSSRDGASGIRFYQVPEGLAWPGQLQGGSVELIQYRHRYAVVEPSIHPKTGRPYRWTPPRGLGRLACYGCTAENRSDCATNCDDAARRTLREAEPTPNVDDLPLLPQSWIDDLTGGRLQDDIPKADLGDLESAEWLRAHGTGKPCQAVDHALRRYEQDLTVPGASRHDTAMRAVARIARMIVEGHAGGVEAVHRLKASFELATAGERRPGEWSRLVVGAVRIAAVDDVLKGDPCDAGPFGVVRPIRQESGNDTEARSPRPVRATDAFGLAHPRGGDPDGAPNNLARAALAAVPDPPAEVVELPGHSWRAVNLRAIIRRGEEERPTVFRRADGKALFYLGRVNGLIGPSESGKSWVALEAVRQELQDGQTVAYIDFEDTARGVFSRLEKLGIDEEDLFDRLRYIAPDEPPGPAALAAIVDELDTSAPRLVVVDGFNAAMTLAGLDLNSNTDATKFFQGLLTPLVRADRAVCYVDHTPKSKGDESRGGIGAQAKRAMTSGTIIRVDKKKDFGPGTPGYLRLFVDKDRMGYVRELAVGASYAAEAIIKGGENGSPVTIDLVEHDPERAEQAAENSNDYELRKTIAAVIEDHPGISKRGIIGMKLGGRERVGEAIAYLVEAEYVTIVHLDGSNRHHLRRQYPGAFE